MPGEAAQQQLDTRALEVASAALGRVEAIEQRIEAREQRADAHRAELAARVQSGFDQVGIKIGELGRDVHARISDEKNQRHRLVLGIAGTTILLLLSGNAVLFAKVMGW